METKICSTCKQSKGLSEFNKVRKNPDYLSYDCRTCTKIRRKDESLKVKNRNLQNLVLPEKATCIRCHKENKIENFYKDINRVSGFYPYCKVCTDQDQDVYYEANKAKILKRGSLARKEKHDFNFSEIIKLKAAPCMDCGQSLRYFQMDYDHLGDKFKRISIMYANYNLDKIQKEIAKCNLVCANCHKQRTANRLIKPTVLFDKKCKTCKITKSSESFGLLKTYPDNKPEDCQDCLRERYAKSFPLMVWPEFVRLKRKQVDNYLLNKTKCDFIKQNACTDCKTSYNPCIMEFDHLRDKTANVAKFISGDWDRVIEEIAKCELVCCNCHRMRTFTRMGF